MGIINCSIWETGVAVELYIFQADSQLLRLVVFTNPVEYGVTISARVATGKKSIIKIINPIAMKSFTFILVSYLEVTVLKVALLY